MVRLLAAVRWSPLLEKCPASRRYMQLLTRPELSTSPSSTFSFLMQFLSSRLSRFTEMFLLVSM